MEAWPGWIEPQHGRLVGVRGWGGRLFAVVEGPDGAAVHFHDGEVRRFDGLVEAVEIAASMALPAVGLDDLSAPGPMWHALELPEVATHPSGARVRVVPVPPGDHVTPESRLGKVLVRVANRAGRLKRLVELDAPEIIVENERDMVRKGLQMLVDAARSAEPTTSRYSARVRSEVDLTDDAIVNYDYEAPSEDVDGWIREEFRIPLPPE